MALNPYFLNGSKNEQGLVQNLVNELIRMAGVDVVYLPRKFIDEKTVIKELLVSKFNSGFSIEAYVLTYDGFGGQGDILSKFGVRSTDEITFVVSKERYEQIIVPFIKNNPDIKLTSRPQEGDLIYFPIDNALFEVKYVEVKKPFYQLNNLYSYQLKCELFEYEDEVIDTGIEEVDKSVKNFGYTQTLQMVSSTATNAEISVSLASSTNQKSVYYIDIINGGYGFKSTPTVKIQKAPSDGQTATAVATLKVKGNDSTIDKILITNPGYGYTIVPKVEVISNSGSGFIGTCLIGTGVLGSIDIESPGSNYSSAPIVGIGTSSCDIGAEAISVITTSGIVTSIRYINAGTGYTVAPIVTIEGSTGITTGTYKFNDVVFGDVTNTKAYVKDWNYETRVLKVSIIDGSFSSGESIVGAGVSYKIYSIEEDDLYDAYASNKDIETEADAILDFSEKNPFGEF
jgi:hypothetical protein